jgi:DNA-directed RNA polymerase subunit RPC12/RpoP
MSEENIFDDDSHRHIYVKKKKERVACPSCNEYITDKVRVDRHPLYLYLCCDCNEEFESVLH